MAPVSSCCTTDYKLYSISLKIIDCPTSFVSFKWWLIQWSWGLDIYTSLFNIIGWYARHGGWIRRLPGVSMACYHLAAPDPSQLPGSVHSQDVASLASPPLAAGVQPWQLAWLASHQRNICRKHDIGSEDLRITMSEIGKIRPFVCFRFFSGRGSCGPDKFDCCLVCPWKDKLNPAWCMKVEVKEKWWTDWGASCLKVTCWNISFCNVFWRYVHDVPSAICENDWL